MKMNLTQLKQACELKKPIKVIVTGKVQFPPNKFPVLQLKDASIEGLELPLRSDIPESFYLPYTDDGVMKIKLSKESPAVERDSVWIGEVSIKYWSFNGKEGLSFYAN